MNIRTGTLALLVVILGIISFLIVAPYLQFILAAGLLAFVLMPVHRRLEDRLGTRVSAGVVTALAFVVAIVPTALLGFAVLSAALEALESYSNEDIIEIIESIRTVLRNQFGFEPATIDTIENGLLTEMNGVIDSAGNYLFSELVGIVNTTMHLTVGMLILVFLLYYFLADGDDLLDWIGAALPIEESVREELFDEVSTVTWAVVQSHLLVAVVQGALGGLGLWLLGVPNAALLTILMVVASVLPVIGVWLVWVPAVGILLFFGDTTAAVLLFIYGITVLSIVDNYVRAIFVDRGSASPSGRGPRGGYWGHLAARGTRAVSWPGPARCLQSQCNGLQPGVRWCRANLILLQFLDERIGVILKVGLGGRDTRNEYERDDDEHQENGDESVESRSEQADHDDWMQSHD
ncbi:MAG: AI-2E family transporter [Natrialbaceae archaeon]|nr:AI-2E family transporter [Natrialbaceae archaeon]